MHYLFVTPYPNGAAADENPSIFSALDGLAWDTVAAAPNPLVLPDSGAYLSDPEAVYVPERNHLRLYYREVTTANIINVIESTDGATWTAPTVVVKAPNHMIVSPAVVRRGPGDWLMWAVNAGALGCNADSTTIELRRSADGLTWSLPETVDLHQKGSWAWHIDVKWIDSRKEYWAIYNAKEGGGCATSALYLATSPDGVEWTTYPTPLLEAGATPALQDIVYRSTLAYDSTTDVITFWYSGARFTAPRYAWSTVMQRLRRADVFARIAKTSVSAARRTARKIPPLINPP